MLQVRVLVLFIGITTIAGTFNLQQALNAGERIITMAKEIAEVKQVSLKWVPHTINKKRHVVFRNALRRQISRRTKSNRSLT